MDIVDSEEWGLCRGFLREGALKGRHSGLLGFVWAGAASPSRNKQQSKKVKGRAFSSCSGGV